MTVESMLVALTKFGTVEIKERGGRYTVVLKNYDLDKSGDAPTLQGALLAVYNELRTEVAGKAQAAVADLSIFHAVEGVPVPPPELS